MPILKEFRNRAPARFRSTLPSPLAGEGLGVRGRAISLGSDVSSHAQTRMQQRGVTPILLDFVTNPDIISYALLFITVMADRLRRRQTATAQ